MNTRLSLAQTNIVFLFTLYFGFKVLKLLILIFCFPFSQVLIMALRIGKTKINWFERKFYKSATYYLL